MKIINNSNFVVLTGAPGSGKTTLVTHLEACGIECVPEFARQVISEQRHNGGRALPEIEPALFVDEMLSRSIKDFNEPKESKDLVLFDRGIPDLMAYAKCYGLPTAKAQEVGQKLRYNTRVFILRPWEDIYVTDNERQMTFKQTIVFGRHLEFAYENLNYNVIEVPQISVEQRAHFILENL